MAGSETRFVFWDGKPNVKNGALDATVDPKVGLSEKDEVHVAKPKPQALSLVVAETDGPARLTVSQAPRARIKEVDKFFTPGEQLLGIKLRVRPVKSDSRLLVRVYEKETVVWHAVFTGDEMKRMPTKDGWRKDPQHKEPRAVSGGKSSADGVREYTVRAWIAESVDAFGKVDAGTPIDQLDGLPHVAHHRSGRGEGPHAEKFDAKHGDKPGRTQARAVPPRGAAFPIVLAFDNGLLELDEVRLASDIAPRLQTALRWKGCAPLTPEQIDGIERLVCDKFAEPGPIVVRCQGLAVADAEKKRDASTLLLRYVKKEKLTPSEKDVALSPQSGWDAKWETGDWKKRKTASWNALLAELRPAEDAPAATAAYTKESSAFNRVCERALGAIDLYKDKQAWTKDHPLEHVPGVDPNEPLRVENDLPGFPATNGGVNFKLEACQVQGKDGFRMLIEVRLNDERSHHDDSVSLSIGYRWRAKTPGAAESEGEELQRVHIATVKPLLYRARVVWHYSYEELLKSLNSMGVELKEFNGEELYVNASFNNTTRKKGYHYHGRKDRGGRFRLPALFATVKKDVYDETIADIREINLSGRIPDAWKGGDTGVDFSKPGPSGPPPKPWLINGGSVTTSMETESEFYLFTTYPGTLPDERKKAVKALEAIVLKMAGLVGNEAEIKKAFKGDADFLVKALEATEDGQKRPVFKDAANVKDPKIFVDHYLDFDSLPLLRHGAILRLRERPRAKEATDVLAVKGASKPGASPVQLRYVAQIDLHKLAADTKEWKARNAEKIGPFIDSRYPEKPFGDRNNALRPALVSVSGLSQGPGEGMDAPSTPLSKMNKDPKDPKETCAERLKIRSVRYRFKIEHKKDPIDIDFSADFASGWLPGHAPSLTEEEALKFGETYKDDGELGAPIVLAFEFGLGHLGAAVGAALAVGGIANTPETPPPTNKAPKVLSGGTVLHTRRSFDKLEPQSMAGHDRFANAVNNLKAYLLEGISDFKATKGGNKAKVMAELLGLVK